MTVDIIMTIGSIILFLILWPLIKWFALIVRRAAHPGTIALAPPLNPAK